MSSAASPLPAYALLAPDLDAEPRVAPSWTFSARSSASQAAALTRLRSRLHDRLIDVIAECDDAGAAVAEGRMERALGGPCLALEALHARLAARKASVAALRAQLAQLDAAW